MVVFPLRNKEKDGLSRLPRSGLNPAKPSLEVSPALLLLARGLPAPLQGIRSGCRFLCGFAVSLPQNAP